METKWKVRPKKLARHDTSPVPHTHVRVHAGADQDYNSSFRLALLVSHKLSVNVLHADMTITVLIVLQSECMGVGMTPTMSISLSAGISAIYSRN